MNFENPKLNKKQDAEQERWEKVLTDEGMPTELDPLADEISEGMNDVWNEIRRHYVEREGADWGAHRQKLQEIRENIKSYKLTPDEEEIVDEDFLRQVEDEISTIEIEALDTANKISQKRPQVVTREKAFEGQVSGTLKKSHPDYDVDVLEVIAHRAVEQAQARMAA
jgi:uncharacterized protein YheU (UPF0270 family)